MRFRRLIAASILRSHRKKGLATPPDTVCRFGVRPDCSKSRRSTDRRIGTLFQTGMPAVGEAGQLPEDARDARSWMRPSPPSASILIDQPGACAGAARTRSRLLHEGGGHAGKAAFRARAGRRTCPCPSVAANIQRFLSELIRARRRWQARFGLWRSGRPTAISTPHPTTRTIWLDTPWGRLPFTPQRGNRAQVGVRHFHLGRGRIPVSAGRRAGACAPGRTPRCANTRAGSSTGSSPSAYLGPRWLDRRPDGSEPARHRAAAMGRRHARDTDQYGLRLEAARHLTPRLAVQGPGRGCASAIAGTATGSTARWARWRSARTGWRCRSLRLGGNAGWNWSRAKEEDPGAVPARTASLGATLGPAARFHRRRARRRCYGRTTKAGVSRHRTIDREPREDKTRILSLSVHNRAVTVLGFSPRLSLINEQRETNAQALDYERNRAELSFVRQF